MTARRAAAAGERLVRAEPFGEAAHRLRIRAHGDLGDRAGAIAAFEHYRAALASGLRSRPTAETEEVLREVIERTAAPEPLAQATVPADVLAAGAVLVVAHHEFQRRTAVTILRDLRVGAITEAAGGAEALAAIGRNGPPDVILSELELPDLDGVELLRRLAERDAASGLILVTALDAGVVSAVEALAEAYGLRLLGVIEKPVTGRRLAELLAAHRRGAAVADDDGRAGVTAADLVAALDGGELGARFRPLADLATGTVNAVTAIPGWEDAAGGWTAVASLPGVLDAADGLAGRLADHTLRLAGALAVRSAAEGSGLAVAVPLPPRALEERDLPDRFAAIAREHAIDPRVLVCNVGERALRRDARALATLARLRIAGFGIVFDRVGSVAAGAEQLARVPLTGLKLDPSLVSGAAARPDQAGAVERALELARAVRLPAAAAGCDGPEEFDLLLRLGCRFAEGAFIAAPQDADGLAAWAAGWRASPAVSGGP